MLVPLLMCASGCMLSMALGRHVKRGISVYIYSHLFILCISLSSFHNILKVKFITY